MFKKRRQRREQQDAALNEELGALWEIGGTIAFERFQSDLDRYAVTTGRILLPNVHPAHGRVVYEDILLMLKILRDWRRSGVRVGADGKNVAFYVVEFAFFAPQDRFEESSATLDSTERMMFRNQSAATSALIYPKFFDLDDEDDAREAAVSLMKFRDMSQ